MKFVLIEQQRSLPFLSFVATIGLGWSKFRMCHKPTFKDFIFPFPGLNKRMDWKEEMQADRECDVYVCCKNAQSVNLLFFSVRGMRIHWLKWKVKRKTKGSRCRPIANTIYTSVTARQAALTRHQYNQGRIQQKLYNFEKRIVLGNFKP